MFLSVSRVLPHVYPLQGELDDYISDEHTFGRLLDLGVIVPRLNELYGWSAHELRIPEVTDLVITPRRRMRGITTTGNPGRHRRDDSSASFAERSRPDQMPDRRGDPRRPGECEPSSWQRGERVQIEPAA